MLARLILGPGREARSVKGQLFSDGIHWQAMSIDAALPGAGKASLRFGEAAGDRSFRVVTDDMGALLHLFDVSDNVAGGQLEVTGQVEDSGRRRVFRGKLEGADYRLVHAPIMARLLSVASLSGIGALLSGEGIPFSRIKGDFVIDDGSSMRRCCAPMAARSASRPTASVDFNAETRGYRAARWCRPISSTACSATSRCSASSYRAAQGEGIFAANFRVAGPLADPGDLGQSVERAGAGRAAQALPLRRAWPTPAPRRAARNLQASFDRRSCGRLTPASPARGASCRRRA